MNKPRIDTFTLVVRKINSPLHRFSPNNNEFPYNHINFSEPAA
jgi:hypothetical protein